MRNRAVMVQIECEMPSEDAVSPQIPADPMCALSNTRKYHRLVPSRTKPKSVVYLQRLSRFESHARSGLCFSFSSFFTRLFPAQLLDAARQLTIIKGFVLSRRYAASEKIAWTSFCTFAIQLCALLQTNATKATP